MIPHHVYYQLAILGLLWLCVILHYAWPSRYAPSPPKLVVYPKSADNSIIVKTS
jgi:hypothetical protein